MQNRLVRLHRPFLVKGWEPNSKFAYRCAHLFAHGRSVAHHLEGPISRSADACVRSAKAVLLSHHNNLDINRNLRMTYSHTLSAAIVLAADLFHAIDGGAADTEIESKKCVAASPRLAATWSPR